MTWQTSTAVLDSLVEEDPAAWQRFVDGNKAALTRFLARLGLQGQDLEEVAQESFLAVCQSLRAGRYLRTRGRLRSWLMAIGYRKAMQHFRRRNDGGKVEAGMGPSFWHDTAERAAAPATAQEQQRAHEDVAGLLVAVRSHVSPRTWLAFSGVVIEGRSREDVARELGMTANAVSIAKHRVLARMRALRSRPDGK